jgi:hypothetical protein
MNALICIKHVRICHGF